MGEYPALSESEIEAIQAQIDRLAARQNISLHYVAVTVNHPSI